MQRPENSAAPPSKRKKSEIWNDFERYERTGGEHRAICKHCQKEFSASSKNGTSNLKKHLKSCLAIKSEESRKEMVSPSQTGDLKNPVVIDGNSVFDEEKSSLDVVRMIMKHGYPLNMIEHELFSIFVENLQPGFKLPSRDTLKAGILRVYGEEKEKLQKCFEIPSGGFHLILSFLTCHGKKNRYCCFTLQFSEDGLTLKKKILALKSIENNYTGETLFEMVKGLLLEWKINKKLCSITVENSSSNEKMVHNLFTWLHHQGYPPHKQKLFHIPCITHVINLLVQDGLDGIVHILHKIRKAIKYLSETANGAQKFQEVDLTSQRWDSVFFMLQSALKYKEIFPYQQSGASDFPINISMEEWDSAKAILECLTFFYCVVQRFLGSKFFITNLYFCDICNISKFLLNWQKSKQPLICSIANKMRVRFDSYCIHFTRVSAVAAVFDPRTKLELVLYSLKDVYGEGTKICSTIKDDIDQIFDGYAEALGSQPLCSSSYGNNDFDVLRKWYKSKSVSRRAELNQYLQEPLVTNRELDILGWWHTNRQKFPTLWTMACDILAIPMSTSISNSTFCIEPMTINSIFNGLDPDIIEASTCGGDWITPKKDNDHSPERTYCPSVFAGTSSSLETQEKHAPFTAETVLLLGNPGSTSCPEPVPTRDTLFDLSSSSLSLEPQPQETHNSSTANAEPMLENRGSMSGPEPLTFVLEPQQKHNSSNANTRLLLENIGSTSGPEPLPDGTAPEVGEILGRNEAQGLQHNSMRSQEYSWRPPPSGWLKFNVGAEVHYSTFLVAVVRDEAGSLIAAEIAMLNETSSLVAEAFAFKCGVNLVKQYSEQYSVRKAIIEGDAPLVVNALKDRKTDAPLEIKGTVQEVFTMLDTLTDTTVDFSCVHESCNSLVYDCIKWASRNGFSGILPIRWFNGASFIGPSCVLPDSDLSMSL